MYLEHTLIKQFTCVRAWLKRPEVLTLQASGH